MRFNYTVKLLHSEYFDQIVSKLLPLFIIPKYAINYRLSVHLDENKDEINYCLYDQNMLPILFFFLDF